MASVKGKRLNGIDANCTDGSDLSKCSAVYSAKIKDSENDMIFYENLRIPATTPENEIDDALILAANPF